VAAVSVLVVEFLHPDNENANATIIPSVAKEIDCRVFIGCFYVLMLQR
jgi:hypothetical protein